MKILLFLFVFAFNSVFAKELYCPKRHDDPLVADPALVYDQDKLLVMGTGDVLSWNSLDELIQNKTPYKVQLKLYQELDNKKIVPLNPDELPWDLQFYNLNGKKYLYGGLMSPREGSISAHWPDDNISRRIKVASFDERLNGWVFHNRPLFGKASHTDWVGHSYGQQIVSYKNSHYVFHEEISQSGVTELFIRPLLSPLEAGKKKKVLGIDDLDLELTRRVDGGHLLEGPRYQRITANGKDTHLIYFSTGDFPTKNYATRVAISLTGIEGPYKIMRDSQGNVVDLTHEYAEKNNLHGVGRAFPFQYRGKNWIIFHGAKDIPGIDHTNWPLNLDNFKRCLFAAPVSINNEQISLVHHALSL